MDAVLKNPYRLFGLTSPITSRELTKRISDLETFIEYDKEIKYPLDRSSSNQPLIRTLEAIQDAARRIESDSDRLFYSLFWFYNSDAVDEHALDTMEAGDVEKAIAIWRKQIDKNQQPKYSWLINSSVFYLTNSKESTVGYDRLYQIIGAYAAIIESMDVIKNEVLPSNKNTVDNKVVAERIVNNLLDYALSCNIKELGEYNLKAIKLFSGYSASLKNYVNTRVMTPLLSQVEEVIKKTEECLRNDDSWKIYNLIEKLKKYKSLVCELDLYSDDYRVQGLINDYAEIVQSCSIFAYNTLNEAEMAIELIKWADELPAYGETKTSITKSKKELEEAIAHVSAAKHFNKVIACLESDINTITDTQSLLNRMIGELKAIAIDNESEQALFRKIASACVVKLVNQTVKIYDNALQAFKQNPELDKLNIIIGQCYGLITNIQKEFMVIDLEDEAENYILDSYNYISKEQKDLQNLVKRVSHGQYLPATQGAAKPAIGGVLYMVSQLTGVNLDFLRIGYVIATLVTGLWPLVILYVVLTVLKGLISSK